MLFSTDEYYFYGYELKCGRKIGNYAEWKEQAKWLLSFLRTSSLSGWWDTVTIGITDVPFTIKVNTVGTRDLRTTWWVH